jgi:HNH endonuclease
MIGGTERRLVRDRAFHRCEYCGMRQECEPFVTYQIEHIVAKQHGGSDDIGNLALACSHCNLHKGPNLTGIDPATGDIVRLFDPRRETWSEHFQYQRIVILGLTPAGRATVRVLDMNARSRLDLRSETLDWESES